MRQKITILLLINFVSMIYAQRISIEWSGSKVQDFGDTKLTLPNIKNEGLSFSQNNIFIVTKQKIGERQIKITNPVWESVSTKDLFDLSKDLYRNAKSVMWIIIILRVTDMPALMFLC